MTDNAPATYGRHALERYRFDPYATDYVCGVMCDGRFIPGLRFHNYDPITDKATPAVIPVRMYSNL